MRVVYFGAGEFAVPSLRWLTNSRHEVVRVITQPDRPAGRGKHLQPTPVAQQAEADRLPIDKIEDVNTAQFVATLKALSADIGVVAAFGQKISEPVRKAFPSECVNLHASLLPKFRGAGPIVAAILAGETTTGVTTFRLVDRMDAGPIFVKRETAIGATETAGELHDRLARVACDALDATLLLHEKDPLPSGQPQDESQASKAPKLKKADGYLRFEEPAKRIARQIRAFWPWPGARCRFTPADGGEPIDVTLVTATALPVEAQGGPGLILPDLTVATGEGTLEIHGVQPAGRKPMSWQDFVNGRHVKPGDRFQEVADGGVRSG